MTKLAILAVLTAAMAFAQGSNLGQSRGPVTDATTSSVPGAKVTVTDVATNTPHVANVDSAGEYEVLNLKPGAYTVNVSSAGFNTLALTGVVVVSGGVARA